MFTHLAATVYGLLQPTSRLNCKEAMSYVLLIRCIVAVDVFRAAKHIGPSLSFYINFVLGTVMYCNHTPANSGIS